MEQSRAIERVCDPLKELIFRVNKGKVSKVFHNFADAKTWGCLVNLEEFTRNRRVLNQYMFTT